MTKQSIQTTQTQNEKNNKNNKRYLKFLPFIIPALVVPALTIGLTLGCTYQCHYDGSSWTRYIDDPGEQERKQKSSGIGDPVNYAFSLKAPIAEEENIMGEARVVNLSHQGVEAQIDNLILDPTTRKAISFDAKITKIPSTLLNNDNSNEKITYYADFEVKVTVKKIVDGQIIWTTTIQNLRISVDAEPVPAEINYFSVTSNQNYDLVLTMEDVGEEFVPEGNPRIVDLEYSLDKKNWTNCEFIEKTKEQGYAMLTCNFSLEANKTVYFRGDNEMFNIYYDWDYFSRLSFGTTSENNKTVYENEAEITVGGEVTTLLNKEGIQPSVLPESAFQGLFHDWADLTHVNNKLLPANNLSKNCYNEMFNNCTKLASAPELPALNLAENCYNWMFSGCNFTTLPQLPASTLAINCYGAMFCYCEKITTIPENYFSNITTLAYSCFSRMFDGCTSLTTVPENLLPVTELQDWCYFCMFADCEKLEIQPKLPATILKESCYMRMFENCKALTETQDFPAMTLANSCYSQMYLGCEKLKTIHELPAKNMANSCYYDMFGKCSSMIESPRICAEVLAQNCFFNMFEFCSSLKTFNNNQPLQITQLAPTCYGQMFYYCSSFKVTTDSTSGIKILYFEETAERATKDMLKGSGGDIQTDPEENTWYYLQL